VGILKVQYTCMRFGPLIFVLQMNPTGPMIHVRYHDDGSKKLNACIRFFLHMVYFNLNAKQCYSQITYNDTHLHRSIYAHMTILYQFSPCFSVLLQFSPFHTAQPLFLLTWRSCFFCLWCEYPSTLVPGLL
jgi:hypothetical protein